MEHSTPSGQPAGLGVRLAARILDTALVALAAVALGSVTGFGYDWLVVSAVGIVLYFVLGDAFAGATMGKAACGLRVVGHHSGRPSIGQALARESFMVLGAIPFAGPLLALGAWTWIAHSIRSNPTRQGKHDLWAGGTHVTRVHTRRRAAA